MLWLYIQHQLPDMKLSIEISHCTTLKLVDDRDWYQWSMCWGTRIRLWLARCSEEGGAWRQAHSHACPFHAPANAHAHT